jgi:diguanylate cyclase (GGDEF)-like protein
MVQVMPPQVLRSRRGLSTGAAPHLSAVSATYGLLVVVLIGYLGSVALRSAGAYSTWLDGWAVDGFEVILCGLAFAGAYRLRSSRWVALALGLAMTSWTLGDISLTIESLHGATPPTPSVADGFYIAFYPLAYLALVLMVRKEASRLVPATWLDGVVAGLGAAALCAAFAFGGIQHVAGGGGLEVATNLAYPIGDVLLLAMVIGGSSLIAGAPRATWLLFAAGCAVNSVGDTVNLVGSAAATHTGTVMLATAWPTALLLMSIAAWTLSGRADVLSVRPAPGFLLPALGAVCGLAVLVAGASHRVNSVAIGCAGATLLVVGARLGLSLRSLRTLTEQRYCQSITDHLTGLCNRRRLTAVLRSCLHEGEPRPVAFLFVDLDRFKEVNDSFGHSAGDELLVQIGPRISTCLGDSDLLVRIGGDEFAVILVDAGREYAAEVATRVSQALREPFELEMVSVAIGASIGIALAPDHAADAAELMRCADQAMYRSKLAGVPHEVYDPALDVEADRLALVDDLRTAIAERQLEMHYQPQIDLRDNTITSVEALIRWPHPRRGFIAPLEFLPLAEEAGLMRALTELVLDESLAQCAVWRTQDPDLSVSVNVSATNILDVGFTDMVRERLERHRVPPCALVLEITETTIISDFARCRIVVDELCALGCRVSIDDFGAGFTSLPYLSRLTIGELKLDRSFLTELASTNHSRDLALIQATIQLAHALGLQVVAEGVEEQSTLSMLGRLGCDFAQGYHIGKPAPAAALSFRSSLAA